MRIESYTDEELRLELRKRANKKKSESAKSRQNLALLVEADVVKVDNIRFLNKDGSIKYYPLLNWIYHVKIDCIKQGNNIFQVRPSSNVRKQNAPSEGDKVLVKCSVRHYKNGTYNYQVGRVCGIVRENDL